MVFKWFLNTCTFKMVFELCFTCLRGVLHFFARMSQAAQGLSRWLSTYIAICVSGACSPNRFAHSGGHSPPLPPLRLQMSEAAQGLSRLLSTYIAICVSRVRNPSIF